jgi:hypothetical protein
VVRVCPYGRWSGGLSSSLVILLHPNVIIFISRHFSNLFAIYELVQILVFSSRIWTRDRVRHSIDLKGHKYTVNGLEWHARRNVPYLN